MKFRVIRLQKKINEGLRSLTKKEKPDTINRRQARKTGYSFIGRLGKNLGELSAALAQVLGTDPYVMKRIGDFLVKIGKKPQLSTTTGDGGNFQEYIAKRLAEGKYTLPIISMAFTDDLIREWPEIAYIRAFLPNMENPEECLIPIFDVDSQTTGALDRSIVATAPGMPYYANIVRNTFMVGGSLPDIRELEKGAENVEEKNITIKAWNSYKDSRLKGTDLMMNISMKMHEVGLQLSNATSLPLQEFIYKELWEYLSNQITSVINDVRSTQNHAILIHSFLKHIAGGATSSKEEDIMKQFAEFLSKQTPEGIQKLKIQYPDLKNDIEKIENSLNINREEVNNEAS